ncbi:hypothetical protein [Mycobacterium sp. CnD-18-1]|uniref:hypothetical protein n=1 Tax=Mycobacterium sp. CnD-18-1 TaxID=2917744 RepID=UPI001EF27FB8|nr:hypothetical protein [Mycobacterium sp. CnD-18-1]MCG7607166.1 hypothetical protein [Mycobacterium sp. CnD-18-1]
MSDWNPAKVESVIQETVNRIEAGVIEVDAAYGEFLKKDLAFDIAEAKAYLAANDKPAHERKFIATLATEQVRLDRDAADRAYKLMEKNMKALERKLDAYRSIGTSVRQAYAQGVGT